jgi:hypothetical protein
MRQSVKPLDNHSGYLGLYRRFAAYLSAQSNGHVQQNVPTIVDPPVQRSNLVQNGRLAAAIRGGTRRSRRCRWKCTGPDATESTNHQVRHGEPRTDSNVLGVFAVVNLLLTAKGG